MKVAQTEKTGADFEIVEREIPTAGPPGYKSLSAFVSMFHHSLGSIPAKYWPGLRSLQGGLLGRCSAASASLSEGIANRNRQFGPSLPRAPRSTG